MFDKGAFGLLDICMFFVDREIEYLWPFFATFQTLCFLEMLHLDKFILYQNVVFYALVNYYYYFADEVRTVDQSFLCLSHWMGGSNQCFGFIDSCDVM